MKGLEIEFEQMLDSKQFQQQFLFLKQELVQVEGFWHEQGLH